MPKIRLKRGEEPVELEGKRLLIGLASHIDVPPGGTTTIEVQPQLKGLVEALLVTPECAASFDLLDLRIARNSQFVSVDPLPLAMFAKEVPGMPAMAELALTDECFREFFDLDMCMVSMAIRVEVMNTSEQPIRFRGCFVYRSIH